MTPGGRDRILLRACILIANGSLRLRMGERGLATRLFDDALTRALKARIGRQRLSTTDWGVRRHQPRMKQNACLGVSG